MMDFGRFRFSNDDDIIVIIDEPTVEEENNEEITEAEEKKETLKNEKIVEIENEEDQVIEITPEMAQDNNNQKLMNKYLNAIGELNFDKKNEKHQDKPSKIETPEEKPIKIVKEDYKNKKLMDKYLHGIGEFKEANYEEEKEEIEEKQPEDLMKKYALDKEVVYVKEEVEENVSNEKEINEEYENKELMDKYLHGIGEFKEANHEEEIEEIEEKQPEDLMKKYALDKEVVYAEEEEKTNEEVSENEPIEDVEIEAVDEEEYVEDGETNEEISNTESTEEAENEEKEQTNELEEQEDVEIEAVDEEEYNEKDNKPITVNVEAVDIEDLTPIELTDDLDAPLLPEPADLTEIVENNINTTYNEVSTEKEKEVELGETFKEKPILAKTKVKKTNPFVVFLIIIVFIALGFAGALYVYNSSNKVIVERTLKHLKEYKQYFAKPYVMDDTDELHVTGDVIFNSSDVEDPINKLKIKYNLYEHNEKRAIDLGIYKDNIEKLNTKINFSNQKLYILFEDIYDKYIQVSNYSYSKDEMDIEEIVDLLDYATVRFTKNINKENFKSENAKIVVNKKEINVKKTLVSLNEKELAEIYNKVIDDIVGNAYYNKILRKITKNDVKIDINDINTTVMDQYVINIYTDKLFGAIKGIDLEVTSKYKSYACEEDLDSYYSEECNDYEIDELSFMLQYRVGDTNEFAFISDNEVILKGDLVSTDEQIVINLRNAKDKELGYIKKTTKKTITTYEINLVDDDFKFNAELKYQVDEVKQNSEYNIDTTLKIAITDSEKETNEFSINTILKTKNKLDKNIDYVTEYINYDDMESEDFDEIVEKIIDIYYDIFEIEKEDFEEEYKEDITLE